MEFIEIVGWVATAIILISFLFDGIKLRIINCIGAVLWLYYGYKLESSSILFLNAVLIGIHLIKIIKPKKKIDKQL